MRFLTFDIRFLICYRKYHSPATPTRQRQHERSEQSHAVANQEVEIAYQKSPIQRWHERSEQRRAVANRESNLADQESQFLRSIQYTEAA